MLQAGIIIKGLAAVVVVSRGGEGSSRGRELVAVVSRAVVTVVSWQSWAWTLGALKQDNTKKEHDKKDHQL